MEKRALISVFDKTGIVDFAKGLTKLGWEIISTGNTKKTLEEAGIPAVGIEEITHFPEILNGRVKTLSPYVFGGLLYIRGNEVHERTIAEQGICPIDMVVVNLYPFKETVKRGATHPEVIENIDIGGPSMIRGAAKNYKDVLVLTDTEDYSMILEKLNSGEVSDEDRKRLAWKAYKHTCAYDMEIVKYFGTGYPEEKDELFIHMTKGEKLRYGENPHQEAYYYQEESTEGSLNQAKILQGKALSFNNLNDANAAINALKEFKGRPTAVGLKHANPCGIASADTIEEAYKEAYEADSVSIFGGIVALNREVGVRLAEKMSEIFLEVIIAPSYTKEALEVFAKKKNLRVLELPSIEEWPEVPKDMKYILGGLLVQDQDLGLVNEMKVVTKRQPTDEEEKQLIFAMKAAKTVKSNGIVIAKGERTLGIGQGEVNRIWPIEEGIARAGAEVKGAVCASDGFFPFGDSLEALAKAGITAVIEPGGSIRDEESIKIADEYNMAMIFTGRRHFRH
ncbi:phosphoribosylaminoimidazolecarboxamide formyltransferase/IMP cyclohydrolase [Peptostreptococcaceae bacterium oral taxon 113 str. W5053]|nr:phosphoribosylaminoimidazolecarboxamide formyltransferase/IMP cyclohydrolase [Peptostreptococcaceae bacterium oral taxon 113 str. W5053]